MKFQQANVFKIMLLCSILLFIGLMSASVTHAQTYNFVTAWGSDGAGSGTFNGPHAVAVDSLGNVYVADTVNNLIQKFKSDGTFITQWGGGGSGNGKFNAPWDVAVDSSNNVYVVDTTNERIQKFDSNGNYLLQWGSGGSAVGQFNGPHGVAVDSSGNVYVADTVNERIQKFDSNGVFISTFGIPGSGPGQFSGLFRVAVDLSGNVYTTETVNERIQKFDSNGHYITQWGSGPGSGSGQFYSPYGVAVDSLGNVYVADTTNNRIQKFDSNGSYITQWGSLGSADGQFTNPYGVAVGPFCNVYVADTTNNRIQEFAGSCNPLLTITKVPSSTTYSAAGQTIVYTYLVTNTGTSTITGIVVTDTPLGKITLGSPGSPITSLAPGAQAIGTATYTIKQSDVDNSVTLSNSANVTDDQGVLAGTGTVIVTPVKNQGLTITKVPSSTTYSAAGQTIVYTYLVTNTGTSTITGIVVTDTPLGKITLGSPGSPITSLAPGAQAIGTATYTIKQSDVDNSVTLSNSASVTDDQGVLAGTGIVTVTPVKNQGLTITKVPSSTTYSVAGQIIAYTYLVTNTGTSTITGIVVTDTPLGKITLGSPGSPITSLAPGAQAIGTATYTIKQSDVDNSVTLSNSASVTDDQGVLAGTGTVIVTPVKNQGLTITKVPSSTTYSVAGQIIAYTYLVTNTGTSTITGIVVTDTPLGKITLGSPGSPITSLAPGAQAIGTATYTIKQSDVDNSVTLSNSASVTDDQGVLAGTGTVIVTPVKNQGLTITKVPSSTTYSVAGQIIAYTYLVTNTGTSTITGIVVTDTPLGKITLGSPGSPITSLAPGAQAIGTATYTIKQSDVDNSVTLSNSASVTDDQGVLAGTGTVIVTPVKNQGLTITKVPSSTTYSVAGQIIAYTYLVTNTGTSTITGIVVTDTPLGKITLGSPGSPITSLAPGAQAIGTATYTIKQSDVDNSVTLSNSASVTDDQRVLTGTGIVIVTPVKNQGLTITKVPSSTTYSVAGQTITYTYLVTNTGTSTITGIVVTDTSLGKITLGSPGSPITSLAPGAQAIGTATYTIKQSDVDNSVTLSNSVSVTDDQRVLTGTGIVIVIPVTNIGLEITKKASPITYDDVGQIITYTYTVKNVGNVDIKGPITVTDDKFGTIIIPNSDTLSKGSSVTKTDTYKITEADINAGSVTNLAYATGLFNGYTITSPKALAVVLYKHREHHEEHPNNERLIPNYGGCGGCSAALPVSMMYGSPMYGSPMPVYCNEQSYGYDSGPCVLTESPNSDSNGHKAKAHLSKHKHKNHSKHHKKHC